MEAVIFYCIIILVVLNYIFERYLDHLNSKSWSSSLPKELQGLYDEQEYQRSKLYNQEKEKLSFWSGLLSISATLILLLSDGFYWIYAHCESIVDGDLLTPLIFFAVLGGFNFIVGIPFSYYNNFKIEESFGFNKMTPKLFIVDLFKGLLLSSIIMGALLSAFIYFYLAFPEYFWLYAWIAFSLFSLIMAAFYVDLIVPIFNNLSPLKDEELMKKIEALAKNTNFPLDKISVIDGSKRSSKANAYFSGIGFKKSIVLFDTLIEDHSHDELIAVLAHEIGHYKKKHVLWNFTLSIISMFVTLFILGWCIQTPDLSKALGASEINFALGLIAFSFLYSPISMLTGMGMNILSRKFEYQADAYANTHASGKALGDALKRLSVKHLSNLTPHSAYVFVNYSHPTLLQRLNALKKLKN